MSERSIGRLFIVGCPRSGTTLLQCLLASHSQVLSFPETAYFIGLKAGQRRRRLLGIASPTQYENYKKFLSLTKAPASICPPRQPVTVRQYTRAFVRILDSLARLQGKTVWLEKTPQHIRYIPLIERSVQGSHFIHIIRNGPDNIASLYDVSNRHTDLWKIKWNVDECIDHWITDVRASLRHVGKPNHLVVGYQQVVENTCAVVQRACDFIGLSYEEAMLQRYVEVADQIAPMEKPYKAGAKEAISNRNGTKFHTIFTEQQRLHILDRIAEVDTTPLGVL